MPRSIIAVNGTHLFVEDSGEPDLPVMLCLHSLFLDSRMFDGLAAYFTGEYRIIRPEFRGQGRSDLSDAEIITMDDAAGDMLALINLLGLRDIRLVAQSMGGDVGVRMIHARPELFRSWIMLGSSVQEEDRAKIARLRAWVDHAGEMGFINQALDETMEIMLGASTRSDPAKADLVALWQDRISAVPRRLLPAMRGVIEREDALHLLDGMTLPVLLVNGEEDFQRPPEWAWQCADRLANAEVMVVPKTGHSPTLEAPEIVLPRVRSFLAAHR
ncbi:alpha/beta fold hydrolase [Paracoccus kondratievae]|uniref:alpha/beta fold hydrolase n=1 Tax=Paracoccus kondratievae TaxID=135740 RepID=UPI0012661DBC|nr:alpha/beta hydrolase [Paracoccus kondratievae]QFQ86682.1 alpha/beta fold hydrolase [Paracoccus kondratievae]